VARQLSPRLKTFLDEEIPQKIADPLELFLAAAEACVGIEEAGGDNKGEMVEAFQSTIGGAGGESWCLSGPQALAAYVEDRLNVACNLYLTEWVDELWRKTPKEYRLNDPVRGCLILWRYGNTSKGHVEIVTADHYKVVSTIGFNTSPSGIVDREGDGVYAKIRSKIGTSNMQVIGYLKVEFQKI